jgi:hypothetical protein
MLAILDDAIARFQKYAFARDREGKVLLQEAEEWVQATNHGWPFSFVNVCEILGFAPDYLRQRLGQWKTAKLESRAKAKIHQLVRSNGKKKRSIVIGGRGSQRLRKVTNRCLSGRLHSSPEA